MNRITLTHGLLSSTLFNGIGGACSELWPSILNSSHTRVHAGSRTFGRPRVPTFPDETQREYYMGLGSLGTVYGDGTWYAWDDGKPVLSACGVELYVSMLFSTRALVGSHTNIALNKPAQQSTTNFDGYASKAVDGDRSGFYMDSSVTSTDDPDLYGNI